MLLLAFIIAIASLLSVVAANTEKVIFIAPDEINLGDARPNLLDLGLKTFTPTKLAIRAALPVAFPTKKEPRGLQSWYLLQSLIQGQRYEVRVCWPATQPTEFWLETYNITHVLNTPSLIQELAAYTDEHQEFIPTDSIEWAAHDTVTSQSALFLRIWAAADFYTSDQKLMQAPLPVDVDISETMSCFVLFPSRTKLLPVLDPFIFNIFPQSLLPTAAYIISLAIGGYCLSTFAWARLRRVLDEKEHVE